MGGQLYSKAMSELSKFLLICSVQVQCSAMHYFGMNLAGRAAGGAVGAAVGAAGGAGGKA